MNKRDTIIFIKSIIPVLFGIIALTIYFCASIPKGLIFAYKKLYSDFYDPQRWNSCKKYPHVWEQAQSSLDPKRTIKEIVTCSYCGASIPSNMTDKRKKELNLL